MAPVPDHRWLRPAATLAAAIAVALPVAGCGGARSPATASGSDTAHLVAFAQCMRAHGVPNFPDPDSRGTFPPFQLARGASKQSGRTAQNACRHLAPNAIGGGGAGASEQLQHRMAQALAFARCMRAHGVTSFPDPTKFNGGLTFSPSGVDANSPQFESAQRICRPWTRSAVTLALG